MARGQQIENSPLSDVSSPDLLVMFHQAKSIKNSRVSEEINTEFLRRDHIKVSESILGKQHETPVVVAVEIAPVATTKHTPRKMNSKNCPTHCFCMRQQALFGAMETKMCCRCGKELPA